MVRPKELKSKDLQIDRTTYSTKKIEMMKRNQMPVVVASCLLLLLLSLPPATFSLTSEAAQLTRSRLTEALSSPSGKLTLSPEIVIPEPSSPTAILLQTSEVTQLSESLRTKAKANTAFLTCRPTSLKSSLKTFCNEQEAARGNFPGPVPVIYCEPATSTRADDDDADATSVDLAELAEAGASGILVQVHEGVEITSLDDIAKEGGGTSSWVQKCKEALECGLQPVPEVIVRDTDAAKWKEPDMEKLVKIIADLTGQDPVSIVLTICSDTAEQGEEESTTLPLPVVSKALGKRVPIVGSIRATAGENRLGEETARFKAAGFTGALLRQDCIPGIQAKPSLEYISDFWAACIGDLKSTRSKSFNFRSKNNMEKSVPLEWAKYQKSVIESGALGDPEDSGPPPGFNPAAGDYQGF